MKARARTRYERQVDPDGVLPPEEREALITEAASAHTAKMRKALKDAQQRRRIDGYVQGIVDEAPALSADQRARLSAILGGA